MEIQKYYEILHDCAFPDLKKLQYKYPTDFAAFLETLRAFLYKPLPLSDFHGSPIVCAEELSGLRMQTVKALLRPQTENYGLSAMEQEIISTAQIERITFDRSSVRYILKGFAPRDQTEERIMGMKQGLDFITDPAHAITEENIHALYSITIGRFLEPENRLLPGSFYRHDAVHVMGEDVEHTGIAHQKLPQAMAELVRFIGTPDSMDDLTKAAVIHFYLAYLHPYFDGNGRMARLLHLWYLFRQGFRTALFVPFSGFIAQNRGGYYAAFSQIEENRRLTGTVDVTPFLLFFRSNVYDRIEAELPEPDVLSVYQTALQDGEITEKEKALWGFVLSRYGKEPFSTKMLERDFGNAAYATIRGFVLKFERLGLLRAAHSANRTKYSVR